MAAHYAGPASLVAWVIGGIAVLLLALTFAEIMAILPVAGGIARVPMFSHGNTVAMAMGWSAWVGYNTTAPIEVEAMLRYLSPYLLGVPGPWQPHALLGRCGVCGRNAARLHHHQCPGREILRRHQFRRHLGEDRHSVAGHGGSDRLALHAGQFRADGGFAPLGLPGILAAVSSGGIIFSFVGFRHVVDMAGEAKNPASPCPPRLSSRC